MPDAKNDPSIVDGTRLWRRIPPAWIAHDDSGARPMSMAFKDRRSGEVSVHIADLTSMDAVLTAYPGVSIVEITAGDVRAVNCGIVRAPIPDDPSHAVICPSPTKSGARTLAAKAVWVFLAEDSD